MSQFVKTIEMPGEWIQSNVGNGVNLRPIHEIYDWAMENMQPGEEVVGFYPGWTQNHYTRNTFRIRRRSCYAEGVVCMPNEVIVLRCGEVGLYYLPGLIDVGMIESRLSERASAKRFERDRAQHKTYLRVLDMSTGKHSWQDTRQFRVEDTFSMLHDQIPAHIGWASMTMRRMFASARPWELYTEDLDDERRAEVLEEAKSRAIFPTGQSRDVRDLLYNTPYNDAARFIFDGGNTSYELVTPEFIQAYRAVRDWVDQFPIHLKVSDKDEQRASLFDLIEQLRSLLNIKI